MHLSRSRFSLSLAIALLVVAVPMHAAQEDGRRRFNRTWQDRIVVLQQPLFSIVFDERSRVMPLVKRQRRVAGLTVTTPSGTYYVFEARRNSESDIVDEDPERIVRKLETQYRRSKHLEIGTVQDVEGAMLVRYEPGVRLIVKHIKFERDRVRLSLHRVDEEHLATTLTLKWPSALSRDLGESATLSELVTRFLSLPS